MLSARPIESIGDGPSRSAYARTPAKALLKNRGALQENAIYQGGATVKGKGALLRTPYRPGSHTKKGMQTAKAVKPTVVITRPLGDKTPFPNRQAQPLHTPAPQSTKIAKLALLDETLAKTPGCLLLPSAKRKSMRLPRSASKKFQTPHGQGRHWDVSDGDVEVDLSEELEDAEVEQADYDEIEYMPPRVPEQPFEPLFDLPDYRVVGKTLLELERSGPYDDSVEGYYAADIESTINTQKLLHQSGAFVMASLKLPELEDSDPFRPPSPPTRVPSRATTARSSSRSTTVKPMPAPARTVTKSIQLSVRPAPPVTRSSSRTVPAPTQPTRSTRATAASRVAPSQLPPTRSATSRIPQVRTGTAVPPTAAVGSRAIAKPGPTTTRTAAPSRSALPSRAGSRMEPARPASVASSKASAASDEILQFTIDDTHEDDFQFAV